MFRIKPNIPANFSNTFDQFKQQLINWVFSTVNISTFKYEVIQFHSELPQLLKQKYYVSANFSGTNCLLIFNKFKDKYYSYLIDRKTLSYNIDKVDIHNVKTTNIKVKLDVSIYDGTIFDGIFVITKNEKLFIITDVYYFKGQDYTKTHIDTKLLTIYTYLESNYDTNDKDNNLVLSVNKLFKL